MYEAVMGAAFAELAAPVQDFHRTRGRRELHGWVETEAPASMPARLLALCLGTPLKPSSGAIRFELDAQPDAERWVRHFPTNTMQSHMRLFDGELAERLGLTLLHFRLSAREGRLVMHLQGLRFLGIPAIRGTWWRTRRRTRKTSAQRAPRKTVRTTYKPTTSSAVCTIMAASSPTFW